MHSKRVLLTSAAAVTCFLALMTATASATSTASKATAAISTLVGCSISNSTGNPSPMTCQQVFGGGAVPETSDGFVPIMDTPVQLSSSQSVFASPSLVTGLYSNTLSSLSSTAIAEGGVFLRAVLKNSAGQVVMIGDPVNECNNGEILGCFKNSSNVYGVTLDQRVQTLNSQLASCLTSSAGVNCDSAQFVQLILQTTSAHSFNFIFPNVGQGTYTLEIQAAVNSAATSTGSGSSVGAAAFGLGSVTVDIVRLVHGFSF